MIIFTNMFDPLIVSLFSAQLLNADLYIRLHMVNTLIKAI